MDEIKVPARKEYLPDILDFINDQLLRVNYPEKAHLLLELIVEEAFINIVNYAYKEDDGEVLIRSKLYENPLKLTVQFIDWGFPFNPLNEEETPISPDIKENPMGGWGIFLIKRNVDHLDYEYREGKNILTLTKILTTD
jgi:anti-sigma regulatory factor (Ser/Thr protein kinase)